MSELLGVLMVILLAVIAWNSKLIGERLDRVVSLLEKNEAKKGEQG